MKLSNTKENKKTALEMYEEFKEIFKENHMLWECFLSIDYTYGYTVSEDIYNTIATASIEAYLKDENDSSLTSISDFLAEGLRDEKITLHEIKSIGKWDLLNAFYNKDYEIFQSGMEL